MVCLIILEQLQKKEDQALALEEVQDLLVNRIKLLKQQMLLEQQPQQKLQMLEKQVEIKILILVDHQGQQELAEVQDQEEELVDQEMGLIQDVAAQQELAEVQDQEEAQEGQEMVVVVDQEDQAVLVDLADKGKALADQVEVDNEYKKL